jgi:DNA-directed RNA polymerase II subunit RPB1
MNIHVPQTVQTQVELYLICNAKERVITPAKSAPTIGAKQDTLMGSFLITDNDTVIDWKVAMNILMTTSVGLNTAIEKNRTYSGKFMYSQIIPQGINMAIRNDRGDYTMRILNGMLLNGKIGKSMIGNSRNNLIHKIWSQYGSARTRNFIDDIQRMVLQWLLRGGFTIGISDVIIPAEETAKILDVIETKRLEINYLITEYENNPGVMKQTVFEDSLMSDLSSVRGNIDGIVMAALGKKNGFYTTITSGSNGSEMNAAQIIGVVGQQIVENKRIQKRFNDRTLPFFFKNDDGAFARGFCHSSFLNGLTLPEFFFHVMAGREGLIYTAIKTADTGYLQRRLIKALEDITVKYDGTVRNANDRVIQVVYGDNGINTESQIEQKLELISLDNVQLTDVYSYSELELEEMLDGGITEKYSSELNVKFMAKMIKMRDELREIQRQISNNPVVLIETYMMPVDLNQIIMNITNSESRVQGDVVDPYYVLKTLLALINSEEIKVIPRELSDHSSIKERDEHDLKFMFKVFMYDYLAPRKCTHKHKFTTKEFDGIIELIKQIVVKARIPPGEAVGFVAAQSIGEPVTQITLQTFHFTGTGKGGVSLGLPRIKEILNATPNIKDPLMKIYLSPEYQKNKMMVKKIASYLKYTVIGDVVNQIEIYFDPIISQENVSDRFKSNQITNIFHASTQNKMGCNAELTNLPWIIKIVLSKEKMLDRNVTLLDIKSQFCTQWANRYGDVKTLKKDEKQLLDKITQVAIISNFDNSPTPIIHVRFDMNNFDYNTLIRFQDFILNRIKLKGIVGITESNEIEDEVSIIFDPDTGAISKDTIQIIYTDGVNLNDIQYINGIDLRRITCSDIVAIFKRYGIEAARTAILKELQRSIGSGGDSVNYQHLEVLVDSMVHTGNMTAVNRHGINKLDTDPLSRAAFEKTVEQLLTAAVFGETDYIRSISARIMVGRLINAGTGSFDLLLDDDYLKKLSTKKVAPIIAINTQAQGSQLVKDLIRKKKANK